MFRENMGTRSNLVRFAYNRNDGMLEYWSNGTLEYWNNGILE